MKASVSIELVWYLAAQEAIAAEFEAIEPEHFLAALLKFVELPVQQLNDAAVGAEAAKQLTAEAELLRQELAGRAIDSTAVRRRLRAGLGKGARPYQGGMMHRSEAMRRIFDAAARLAADAGDTALTALHLLRATLLAPTPVMVGVLGEAVAAAPPPDETPLLDAHAPDLLRQAAAGELGPPPDCKAQCTALVQTLLEGDGCSVLLVGADESAARAVVLAAAHALAARKGGPAPPLRRLMDLSSARPYGAKGKEAAERMTALLGEAARAKGVVLVLPPVDASADAAAWADLVRGLLGRGPVRCIMRVAPETYRDRMEKDAAWKRLARAIWVHPPAQAEVPWEI